MMIEHDLTGMPEEKFRELWEEANRRCSSGQLRDVLFELDEILRTEENYNEYKGGELIEYFIMNGKV
jgi:hypothetical protein